MKICLIAVRMENKAAWFQINMKLQISLLNAGSFFAKFADRAQSRMPGTVHRPFPARENKATEAA